jgi:hypothetical protein
MTTKTMNLMLFPTITKATATPVEPSRKDAAAGAAAAAEKMDLIKIDQLTGCIYAISFNRFFKAQGFELHHLAAAALSVATQHMAGVSEAGVAATAEAYANT